MSRLILLIVIAATLVLAGCGEENPPPARDSLSSGNQIDRSSLLVPKGVLLIVVDTLRRDHLGIYNPDKPFTPAIDAFAAESIVFDAMYASSSWTRSSIASIFTSRYPAEINIVGKDDVLVDDVLTLAEVFKANEFDTYGINTNGNAGPAWNMGQGFDHYGSPYLVPWPEHLGRKRFSAERVTKELTHWLDNRESDNPAFIYTLYVDPHGPYFVYPELMDRPEPAGRFDGSIRSELMQLDALMAHERTADDEDRIRYQYESEVRNTDRWIGQLMENLKERGLYDDFVIVLTADHGEELWDRGLRAHGSSLHDEMVRVPLIIRFPTDWKLPPGRTSSAAGHVDIAPTLLATAGISIPDEFVGIDLWDDAEDYLAPIGQRVAYSEMDRRGRNLEAVSNGQEKLLRNRYADNNLHINRVHITSEGEDVWWLSMLYFQNHEHFAEILAANPEFFSTWEGESDTDLPVGINLVIPDRDPDDWGPTLKTYDLARDAGEKQDIFNEKSVIQQALMNELDEIKEGIRARTGTGRSLDQDNLDEETLEDLRGLGYIQ